MRDDLTHAKRERQGNDEGAGLHRRQLHHGNPHAFTLDVVPKIFSSRQLVRHRESMLGGCGRTAATVILFLVTDHYSEV